MLGKLMKYDLRNCFRRFGPLWIAILALALLNGVLMHSFFQKLAESGGVFGALVSGIPPVALFVLLTATAVLAFIFVCERFYNGLLGDEGYLMFTLPATVSQHIIAKALSALILWVISFVVAIASGFLFLVIYDSTETFTALRQIPEALRMVKLPFSVPLLLIEIIILLLIGAVNEILKIYAAISIGHLLGSRRKLVAIVSYFVISIAESILATFAMGGMQRMGMFTALAGDQIGIEYVNGVMEISGLGPVAGIVGIWILGAAVLCVVYFLVTRHILSRNLNLE